MAERQALGIDINKYARTGGINYELVHQDLQAGVYDFIIISTGVGRNKSPILDEQRRNAEKHDIPYATYHLIDPRDGIREQARDYFNWVGAGQPNYIVDIESPDSDGGVRPANKAELKSYINELVKRTGKQPILYSSVGVLNQIGFAKEARKYRLWIAQYLYDLAKPIIDDKGELYRYFEDFVRDRAGRLPPSVVGTGLEDNVILWQFSSKGDGRHYIYNPTTADPQFTQGMLSADLNISIQGRSEFMQFMFGRVPEIKEAIETPVIETQVVEVVEHESLPGEPTYPGMSNQDMINLIFTAAEPFTDDPWNFWVVRAHLESLAVPSENRVLPYTGPRIEDLPNLTNEEKSAILAGLGISAEADTTLEEPLTVGKKAIFTPSGKALARFAAELNKSGRPIWSIFPSDDAPVKDRIFFKKPFEVEEEPVTGDGGAQCYKLVDSPISTPLYVRLQDGTITKS